MGAPDQRQINGYICFYRGKRMEVYAASTYAAQQQAAERFRARKSYEVTVGLAELDVKFDAAGNPLGGEQVTHIAVD